MSNLGIDPLLLLAQVVNFLLLFFILKKFLYKPVIKILNERQEKIETGLRQTKEIGRERMKLEQRKIEELSRARREAERIMENAKTFGEKIKNEMANEAQKQSEEITNKARLEIIFEKEKAMREVKQEIADLVILASEKILKEKIDGKKDKELIEETIKNI